METKWYESRELVFALLIACLPVGLYGLWRTHRISAGIKSIIVGGMATVVIIVSFQAAYRENRFVTADASISDRGGDKIRRMAVPYDQAVDFLTDVIPLKPSEPAGAEDRYWGVSQDQTVSLEIIGDRHAISRACLTVRLPGDTPQMAARNRALLLRFLENLLPEWAERTDWTDTVLEEIVQSSDAVRTTVVGYKQVRIGHIKALDKVEVTVKHA